MFPPNKEAKSFCQINLSSQSWLRGACHYVQTRIKRSTIWIHSVRSPVAPQVCMFSLARAHPYVHTLDFETWQTKQTNKPRAKKYPNISGLIYHNNIDIIQPQCDMRVWAIYILSVTSASGMSCRPTSSSLPNFIYTALFMHTMQLKVLSIALAWGPTSWQHKRNERITPSRSKQTAMMSLLGEVPLFLTGGLVLYQWSISSVCSQGMCADLIKLNAAQSAEE